MLNLERKKAAKDQNVIIELERKKEQSKDDEERVWYQKEIDNVTKYSLFS